MFELKRQGAIAVLRYHHPPNNLLTVAALAQLRRLIRALERDRSVRVIMIAGAIAHTELDEIERMLALAARMPLFLLPLFRLWVWLVRHFAAPGRLPLLDVLVGFDALQRSSKITIAALEGLCIGGGLELALCCDYRLAAEDAVVGCPEVRMGLMPGFGGSQRLAALIGTSRARELLLAGELVTATEAARLGIVSRLLPRDGFERRALDFAADLAQRPPLAVAAVKRALADDLWPRLWTELREVMRLASTRDVAVGLAEYRRALQLHPTADPTAVTSHMSQLRFTGR